VNLHPGLQLRGVIGVQLACQLPQMLTSVVKIDNVKGAGKMQGGQIPNPFRPVAHHHPQEGAAPAPFPGFPIKASAELLGGFDGAGIGGGIGSADRVALLIPRRLREDAPQFDFPRMGRLTGDFALPTHRLFLHHRDSRPIHLHVQDGNRLAPGNGQVQLAGLSGISFCSRCAISARSPPPYAPPIWRSPPSRRELSSVPGPDRRGPPGPPAPACGAPRERIPCSRCPVRHRRGIGRRDSPGTSSRAATPPPAHHGEHGLGA
jgi:hypothetical protein